jgi:tripartite-type tricarboxylate transporter receptor subunit TctC
MMIIFRVSPYAYIILWASTRPNAKEALMRSKLAILAALALPLMAAAQPSPYAGKTVTIIVGYKAGGGYDATARLLARHLPKHIPGKPVIIVQNMPGANSLIAANHVFSVAKPDGLTMGTFNRNLPIAQLTKVDGVKFDLRRFVWIGSAASEATVLAIRTDLPYQSIEDMKRASRPIVIGATGPGANTYDFPLLLKELLGLNLKIVTGYSSSADIMLAIERKEVDGRAGSVSSITPFIDRKLVRAVIAGRSAGPSGPLPVDENLAPNPRAKAIMALRSAPEVIGRPYVMPPGTPAQTAKLMRDAFAKVMQDKELVADAAKAKTELNFVDGDEAQKIIKEVLEQPKDVVEEFSRYIKFGE